MHDIARARRFLPQAPVPTSARAALTCARVRQAPARVAGAPCARRALPSCAPRRATRPESGSRVSSPLALPRATGRCQRAGSGRSGHADFHPRLKACSQKQHRGTVQRCGTFRVLLPRSGLRAAAASPATFAPSPWALRRRAPPVGPAPAPWVPGAPGPGPAATSRRPVTAPLAASPSPRPRAPGNGGSVALTLPLPGSISSQVQGY